MNSMNAKSACLMICAAAALGAPSLAAAQQNNAGVYYPPGYKVPRNGLGQPDFSGTWTNVMTTRLERPKEFGDRLVMTREEVAAVEGDRAAKKADGARPTAQDATITDLVKTCNIPGVRSGGPDCGVPTAFIDAGDNVGRVHGEARASLITFPADGHIPFRPEKRPVRGVGKADNPEDRTLPDRCIVGENTWQGMVMMPTLYNNTYVIQEGKDAVVVVLEMSHEPRIIRLNAQHSPYPNWYGDTIGHWEGDTLVAETTNYHPEELGDHNSSQVKITERFTRVGPDRLLYQFRVEDPVYYTQPWGGEYEFSSSKGMQYEYACHEGNYGLVGILQGARADERAGKKTDAPLGVSDPPPR